MPQDLRPIAGWQALTAQELAEWEQVSRVLREQVSQTEAPLVEQVRMRFVLWMMETGLETKQADRDLLDRLCPTE